jgi:hypothetical protein
MWLHRPPLGFGVGGTSARADWSGHSCCDDSIRIAGRHVARPFGSPSLRKTWPRRPRSGGSRWASNRTKASKDTGSTGCLTTTLCPFPSRKPNSKPPATRCAGPGVRDRDRTSAYESVYAGGRNARVQSDTTASARSADSDLRECQKPHLRDTRVRHAGVRLVIVGRVRVGVHN